MEASERTYQSVINHPESFFYKAMESEIREAKATLDKINRAISEKRDLIKDDQKAIQRV